jgi:hypothetical protein
MSRSTAITSQYWLILCHNDRVTMRRHPQHLASYAWTGSPYVVPCAMAKAGVLALTRSLASNEARRESAPWRSHLAFPTKGAWDRHGFLSSMPVAEPQRDPHLFFPKNALTGLLTLALAWLEGVAGGPSVLSSIALPHAATTLASKGLCAANRLIVACDTLKLRATSACASPLASLCMASRR